MNLTLQPFTNQLVNKTANFVKPIIKEKRIIESYEMEDLIDQYVDYYHTANQYKHADIYVSDLPKCKDEAVSLMWYDHSKKNIGVNLPYFTSAIKKWYDSYQKKYVLNKTSFNQFASLYLVSGLLHEVRHTWQYQQRNDNTIYAPFLKGTAGIASSQDKLKVYDDYHDYFITERDANLEQQAFLYELAKTLNMENNYIKLLSLTYGKMLILGYYQDNQKERCPLHIEESLTGRKVLYDQSLDTDLNEMQKLRLGLPVDAFLIYSISHNKTEKEFKQKIKKLGNL